MAGLGWFIVGIGIGVLYGTMLGWTVAALQPERVRHALALTWGGMLLRCLTVAVLLAAIFRQALSSGLWAFGGFFLARLAWIGYVGLHATNEVLNLPEDI